MQIACCDACFLSPIYLHCSPTISFCHGCFVDVPMPFLSTLIDRFTSAKAKGRSEFDWSAIGLGCAEDAGIDIGKDIERNKQLIEKSKQ